MVAEKHHASVVGLRDVGEEVEGAVVVQEKILRVPLLRTNNIGSLDRIAAEEDRLSERPVRNHIKGKSKHIPS